MKITDKQIDKLNIELTLEIVKEDYEEIEKKRIAKTRRTADFKGFRKGNVPESLIRKVYGEQILVESVNEVISKGLGDYIEGHQLNVLGEPLSSEKQGEVEWIDGNEFKFVFDIATTPEISLDVVKEDTVTMYNVTVSDKDKSTMTENLKKFYEEKKETRTDEEIDKEVTDRLEEQYKQEAEWKLSKDIRDYFVKKADISLPEAFLKRWLFTANEGKFTMEDIEKDFNGFAEDFKWQLVRGYLMKKFDFKIEQKDIEEAAEAYVAYQYAMYGIGNVPAEMIKEAANNVLSDRKQLANIEEQVEDRKVMDKLRETITIKNKKIAADKFRELK